MKLHPAALPILVSLLGLGCATPPPPSYVATTLQPTTGNTATGTVWFIADGGDVRIRGRVTGLKPNQEHGFHVHEKGDCSSGDAMSAGGHLNPSGKPHGPPSGEHHAGDLPALKADGTGDRGRSTLECAASPAGRTEFAGKALVVHVSPDDYSTQPTGNSGARIACGVIAATPPRDASGQPLPLPQRHVDAPLAPCRRRQTPRPADRAGASPRRRRLAADRRGVAVRRDRRRRRHQRPPDGARRRVARWLRAQATPEVTRWMLLVTDLHSTIAVSCYAAIVAPRSPGAGMAPSATVFLCVAGGLTLNVLMKLAFHRARPVLDDPLLTLSSYSFPSGHVAGSTLMYGLFVAWTFARTRRPLVRARRRRRRCRRDRPRRVHAHVPRRPLPERRRRGLRRRRRLAGALPERADRFWRRSRSLPPRRRATAKRP